ncbi:hypothetical protein EVAR_89541_1 [Eumeta japonica]|uniref:Uncharacterized protein n=1 Tax=Eumeta variegata TaxID=151549 RepID=A0A4C1Z9K7_EUMVA|nr:hypothetical protein EVAR_89541_1 [Eumeta japonica]
MRDGDTTYHHRSKIGVELIREAERDLNLRQFCATLTSDEASGKHEGATAVNQLRGGKPQSDKPTHQSDRGSTYGLYGLFRNGWIMEG